MKKMKILLCTLTFLITGLMIFNIGELNSETGEPCGGNGVSEIFIHWWGPYNTTVSYYCHNCAQTPKFYTATFCDSSKD